MRVDYQSGINSALSTIGGFAQRQAQINKQAKIDENQARISDELQKQQAAREQKEDEYKKAMLTASQSSAESAAKQAGTMQSLVENLTGISLNKGNGNTDTTNAPTQSTPAQPQIAPDPELTPEQIEQQNQIKSEVAQNVAKPMDLNDPNSLTDFIISLGNQFDGIVKNMPAGLPKMYTLAMVTRGLWSTANTESNNKRTGINQIVQSIYDYPYDPTRNSGKGSDYHRVATIRYNRGNNGIKPHEWEINQNYGTDVSPDAQRMREKRDAERDVKRSQLENKSDLTPKPPTQKTETQKTENKSDLTPKPPTQKKTNEQKLKDELTKRDGRKKADWNVPTNRHEKRDIMATDQSQKKSATSYTNAEQQKINKMTSQLLSDLNKEDK